MRDNSLVLRICPEERSRLGKTFTFSRTNLSLFNNQKGLRMDLWKSSNFDKQAKKMTRLVVQMGTCDGERAAAAAMRLVDDVAGNKFFLTMLYHHTRANNCFFPHQLQNTPIALQQGSTWTWVVPKASAWKEEWELHCLHNLKRWADLKLIFL